MKLRVINVLLCCAYLWVAICGSAFHSHDEHGDSYENDCSACVLHFAGTADEPDSKRFHFTPIERAAEFQPFAVFIASSDHSLAPGRGPPSAV